MPPGPRLTLPLLLALAAPLGMGPLGVGAGDAQPLTDAEKVEVVNEHNRLRRLEGASDMLEMKYDETYAASAIEWSKNCSWRHVISLRDTLRYKQTGQNMWVTTGTTMNIPGAVQAWYNEKQWYNYDTDTCQSGQVCGHYTQVVWAQSYLVGCGKVQCDPLYDEDDVTIKYNSALMLICNYGPTGNNEKYPFYKGVACSNCTNWKGYCRDSLCHDCTEGNCDCPITCKNCGTLKSDTCACDCPQGWGGQDCSLPCENAHTNCGAGWPKFTCNMNPILNYVVRLCPALCDKCTPGTPPACENPGTTQSAGSSSTSVTGSSSTQPGSTTTKTGSGSTQPGSTTTKTGSGSTQPGSTTTTTKSGSSTQPAGSSSNTGGLTFPLTPPSGWTGPWPPEVNGTFPGWPDNSAPSARRDLPLYIISLALMALCF